VTASAACRLLGGHPAPREARRERGRELGGQLRPGVPRETVDVHARHVVDHRVGRLRLEAGPHERGPPLGRHLADPVGVERRIAAVVPEDTRHDARLGARRRGQERGEARVLGLRVDDAAAPRPEHQTVTASRSTRAA
jgi:hypothetical protein